MGDPILFVHAYPFNAAMWEPQMTALPDGWRGIAVDLPGFGDSASAGAGGADATASSIDSFADGLAGVMDVLSLESAVICGLSMGGYTALSFMRRHPERVRALVLCDTRAQADTAEARRGRLEQVQQIRSDGIDTLVETMLPKLITLSNRIQHPELRARVEALMRATPPESAARALTAIAHRADSNDLLRSIVVPTLVMVGAEDEITPPGDAQMMARAIRGARLEVIGAAGHLSNLEQPALFNAALHRFLESLPN